VYAPRGTGQGRGRDSGSRDLVLTRLLADPPRKLLGYGTAAAPEFARFSHDQATPAVTRRLLGRRVADRSFGLVQDVLKQQATDSVDLLYTLLTRAHRDVALPDGTSWLLVIAAPEPSSLVRSVAWAQIGEPGGSVELVRDLEVYPLPAALAMAESPARGVAGYPPRAEVEPLREELALVALQTGWRPRVPQEQRALLVLGQRSAAMLGKGVRELVARAAVEGVHLTIMPVPGDSSTRAWQETRRAALEIRGPTVAMLEPAERSALRLMQTLTHQGGRQVGSLPTPPTCATLILEVLDWLAPARIPVSAPPVALSEPAPPPVVAPRIVRTAFVVYLAKTGGSGGYDVLEETSHRCGHKKTRPVMHGNAPKKYKGVLRYLGRLPQEARLISAVVCKTPGCGLVTARYEILGVDADDPAVTPVGKRAPPGRRGSARGEAVEEVDGRLPDLDGGDAVQGGAGVGDGPGGGEDDRHGGGGRLGERPRGLRVGQVAGVRGEFEVVVRSGHRFTPQVSTAGAQVRHARRRSPE